MFGFMLIIPAEILKSIKPIYWTNELSDALIAWGIRRRSAMGITSKYATD